MEQLLYSSNETSIIIFTKLVKTRTFFSGLGLLFTGFIIVIYFLYIVMMYKERKKNIIPIDNKYEDSSSDADVDLKSKSMEISDANDSLHYILLLMLSFFIYEIYDLCFYFINKKEINSQKTANSSNITSYCNKVGVMSYILEYSIVFWITSIINLFSRLIQGKRNPSILFHVLLAIILCFGLSCIIYFRAFGSSKEFFIFKRSQCVFYQDSLGKALSALGTIYIFLNTFYNFYCLFHVLKYYKDTLNDTQNTFEKKEIKSIITAFKILPIYILISRISLIINRGFDFILRNKAAETFITVLEYISNISNSAGGIISSVACYFFFHNFIHDLCSKQTYTDTTKPDALMSMMERNISSVDLQQW